MQYIEHLKDFDFIIYKKTNDKSSEIEYNNLVQKVLNTEDLCYFGSQMKFDLQKGFPLLTGKKCFSKESSKNYFGF